MLAPDTTLGPYKIVAPIGAGGMGEVYRAVDTRLGREVAVKVLSAHLTNDTEATRRFEQEARAAGMLNHPNILAIYDIGIEGNQRYIVSELLEGESLRARIRSGAIHPRKATEYAAQIARGLAAAHDRGIVHRDLKPENLFLTRDGLVKILDFGLVKLLKPLFGGEAATIDDQAQTLRGSPTEPGRVIGTVGYMSPEQIRGGSGDQRSDIFAFGAILFEMLAGRPAFEADSPIETLNAVLREEPPEFADAGIRAPDALERIVRHCLEKNPDERFQSARDLAFHLGAMSGLTTQTIPTYRLRFDRKKLLKPLLFGVIGLAALAGAWLLGTQFGRRKPATFARISFRSGTILSARFSPDGSTVFYGARLGGAPSSVFSVRSDSPESRDLGFGNSEIAAVSSTGQLAILLNPHFVGYLRQAGTLAQVPIAGGAPRQILEEVEAADWSPDGRGLAIVRTVEGRCRLEYPIGKVLYSTVGWITTPRFDPSGRRLAFADHPFPNDDRGTLSLIDVDGSNRRSLTDDYESIQGVAWSPKGREILFAAHRTGSAGRELNAVTPAGKVREVAASAGWLFVHDIAADGTILASQQDMRAGIMASVPGESRERDLSWLDYSVVRDLSNDGKTILFSESGEAGGSQFGVYIRGIDGSPAVRLGEGTSESLSPDGRWVLSIPRGRKPAQIVALPTGAGQPRRVTNDHLTHRNARWFHDGTRILFQANQPGHAPRLWVQSIEGGEPRAITPENVYGTVITPDERKVVARGEDRRYYFYPIEGGTREAVRGVETRDVPVRFAADGRSLYVASFGKIPAVLTRVDLATGERTVWREAAPADRSGLINAGPIFVTADGSTTVYSYTRLLSSLYLVRSW